MLLFYMLPTGKNEDHFEKIFEKYKYIVYSVGLEILKDEQYAEDVVSETFYKVAKHFNKVKNIPNDEIGYYIIAIAKNTAYTMYTQIHKRADILTANEENELLQTESNEFTSIERFESSELYDCIDKLPEKQKTMLLYKYGYGFTIKEISKMFDEKENTVKVYLQRAKKKLAELLNIPKDRNV